MISEPVGFADGAVQYAGPFDLKSETEMPFLRCCLTALVFLFASVSASWAYYEYAVRGVAADDVLNVRKDVAGVTDISSAPVVAKIPADARDVKGSGRTIMIGKARWHEIVYEGVTGWVNGRYLQDISTDTTSEPRPLLCTGAEPFWSLDFTASPPRFKSPAGANGEEVHRMELIESRHANGRPHIWSLTLESDAAKWMSTAVLKRTDQCSDGMSDFLYPFEVVFVSREGNWDVLHGCCALARSD